MKDGDFFKNVSCKDLRHPLSLIVTIKKTNFFTIPNSFYMHPEMNMIQHNSFAIP